MNPSPFVLAHLLLLVGCGGSTAPASGPTGTAPAHHDDAHHEASHHDASHHDAKSHEAADHDAKPHTHRSTHGGIPAELGDVHAEAVISPDGVLFYLSDVDEKPLAADGWSGTAVLKVGGAVQTVDLVPMGDHLHALAKLEKGAPATVVLTVTKDGKARSASFETPGVGMAAHDHTSLHGGQVSMWGDFHLEYLGGGDTYRAWVTDAHRNPVREGVVATLTDGTNVVPLGFDAPTGLLTGKGPGAGTRPVTIDVTVGATKFTLAFNASGDTTP